MRRIVLVLSLTATAVVLLFSYRTSRGPEALAAPAAQVRPAAVPSAAPAASGPGGGDAGAEGTGESGTEGAAAAPPAPSAAAPAPAPAVAPAAGAGQAAPAAPPARRTVQGQAVFSQYGTTQVAAVLEGRKLVDVQVLQHTTVGGRSTQIDAYALPQLRQEALAAGSATIDAVSGATITSEGYVQSLQSALDRA